MQSFVRAFLCHLLSIVALGLQAAETVTLAWDLSPSFNVVQYVLYAGTNSGVYQQQFVIGNMNTITVSNLVSGSTTFFVVTAKDNNGLESDPSNEISYTVPGPMPPKELKVTVVVQSSTNLLGWIDRASFEMPVTALLQSEFWRATLAVDPPPLP